MAEEIKEPVKAPLKIKKKKAKIKREKTVLDVKRDYKSNDKILLGVSKKLSKIVGVDINIIRAIFFVSSILLIGIPVYLILSLVLED